MKNKYVILLILIEILIACQPKTKKMYYKTGQLWVEQTLINKKQKIFYSRIYFPNGTLQREGYVFEGGRSEGHWKEYYSDGVLKWEGDYDHGQLVISKDGKWPDFTKMPAQVSIEGSPDILKLGQSYKVRILMPQVHSSLYIVVDENKHKIPENKDDPEKYPYVITPNATGKIHYFILFPNKNGYFIMGNQMRIFELTVQK
jgi:hypothetical protein